jgi:hypothetical protein
MGRGVGQEIFILGAWDGAKWEVLLGRGSLLFRVPEFTKSNLTDLVRSRRVASSVNEPSALGRAAPPRVASSVNGALPDTPPRLSHGGMQLLPPGRVWEEGEGMGKLYSSTVVSSWCYTATLEHSGHTQAKVYRQTTRIIMDLSLRRLWIIWTSTPQLETSMGYNKQKFHASSWTELGVRVNARVQVRVRVRTRLGCGSDVIAENNRISYLVRTSRHFVFYTILKMRLDSAEKLYAQIGSRLDQISFRLCLDYIIFIS